MKVIIRDFFFSTVVSWQYRQSLYFIWSINDILYYKTPCSAGINLANAL